MAKDLTIRLGADEPGAVSKVAEALAAAGINLEGFAEVEGLVHVLLGEADVERAAGALERAGLEVAYEHDVVVVAVDDEPGGLARLTRQIAEAGVNLRFVYLATGTRVVFAAHDPAALRRVLS